MDRILTCESCQEIFPLAAAETATDEELRAMEEHLRNCRVCLKAYEEEYILLKAATCGGNPHSPLSKHPDVNLIRRFVMEPESLPAQEKSTVGDHLTGCDICQASVDILRELPKEGQEILNDSTAPVLTKIDKSLSEAGPKHKLVTALWSPWAGYAAAALLLLSFAGLMFDSSQQPTPAAVIDISIPASIRSVNDTLLYVTPTRTSFLNIRFQVLPEEEHQYALHLIEKTTNDTLFRRVPLTFEPGNDIVLFTVLASVGSYLMIFEDIIDDDTLTVSRSFRLDLLEQTSQIP